MVGRSMVVLRGGEASFFEAPVVCDVILMINGIRTDYEPRRNPKILSTRDVLPQHHHAFGIFACLLLLLQRNNHQTVSS